MGSYPCRTTLSICIHLDLYKWLYLLIFFILVDTVTCIESVISFFRLFVRPIHMCVM